VYTCCDDIFPCSEADGVGSVYCCYDRNKSQFHVLQKQTEFLYAVLLDASVPALNRREIKYLSFIWEHRKLRRMTQQYNTDLGEDATLADVKESGSINSESLLAAHILTAPEKEKGQSFRFTKEIIPYGQCGTINLLENSVATSGFAQSFHGFEPSMIPLYGTIKLKWTS
jgi:hypothetical protein